MDFLLFEHEQSILYTSGTSQIDRARVLARLRQTDVELVPVNCILSRLDPGDGLVAFHRVPVDNKMHICIYAKILCLDIDLLFDFFFNEFIFLIICWIHVCIQVIKLSIK